MSKLRIRVEMKPRFRVPLMSELTAVEPNGLIVASTFSGCGGSSLGYKLAGFDVRYANEFIPAAQDTYRLNHPTTLLDTRDVRTVKGADIIEACGGVPDVLDGSPPCSSFSRAGKGSKLWGQVKKYSDTKQRVDDLFDEYVRLVGEVRPRAFLAENVTALCQGRAVGYFKKIFADLKSLGYKVRAANIRAVNLGVPQLRSRLFVVGIREDAGVSPRFPRPLSYTYSIRDALPWVVPNVDYSEHPDAPQIEELKAASLAGYARWHTWHELQIGEQCSGKNGPFQFWRTHPDRPCPTLCQGSGNVGSAAPVHPFEPRAWTVTEVRRLMAFPDDFVTTGTREQQWERLTRAVPPVMMGHIAGAVRNVLLGVGE